MPSVITRSEEETEALGKRLGRLLQAGDFIALIGELGAGKTRFVRGVAEGLAVDPAEPVTSPTYALLHIHGGGRLPLYHFDLYRLAGDEDAAELGFAEYFHGDGVSLVEWAERLTAEMPDQHLSITFSHLGEEERRIEFAAAGKRYAKLIMSLFP
ncbi:MAG TPA: tRNA (adenosine(37)-N6)-threonylcarbamoyltransferase complex ATPase subunit type 1 TsaE [Geobacteraceae bacterium]